jgi:very-short-patch-repair endonuclease
VDGDERVGGVIREGIPPRHGEGDHAKHGGGGYPPAHRPETYTARKLRKNMSLPEVLLWQRLRSQSTGLKFRRQHPIGAYVADFYCAALHLVIEVDGPAHDHGDRPASDVERNAFLKENGYQVLRIAAADILKDAELVAEQIASLYASPLHHPAGGPPPCSGEELA